MAAAEDKPFMGAWRRRRVTAQVPCSTARRPPLRRSPAARQEQGGCVCQLVTHDPSGSCALQLRRQHSKVSGVKFRAARLQLRATPSPPLHTAQADHVHETHEPCRNLWHLATLHVFARAQRDAGARRIQREQRVHCMVAGVLQHGPSPLHAQETGSMGRQQHSKRASAPSAIMGTSRRSHAELQYTVANGVSRR